MSDQVILGISNTHHYRFTIVNLTETAKEPMFLHSLNKEMSVFLSKTMMGALFLAEMTKNQQKVSIQWKDESNKQALAYSDRYGKMKSVAYSASHEDGDIRNEFILGQGIMKVIRWDYESDTYQSYTNLIEDTFEANFIKYLTESEQIKAMVGMEVVPFDFPGNDFSAKGIFFEALPDATNESFVFLQTKLNSLIVKESFWTLTIEKMLETLELEIGSPLEVLSKEIPEFLCDCSRHKVADIIASLGEQEANSIIDEMGKIEITCEFCRTAYQFDSFDVEKFFKQ
ncbi:Hsp33 family molecular chaperone HslO [Leptospira bouyouniensis]|uniref:Hsp33 family molecular chaperone HslO n=2 Tax=Leptospira bouyouniensis TaxID=2484911 RepID=A0A7I0HWM5_9LEPT|nr:Hsp33 family molecular chaperone HslO [Leptospira bouyouniensis]TGK49049.1 Hsp33 family molecular chaperone HslO [Leptospira bouyouniensis]TGL08618.1 Hsp33 family molecular chaperone HslO [Leptospira bouyouniensis]TGM87577.1 Hsp33 family molecular chaperone HslO [Leptospira bouyouniensis]